MEKQINKVRESADDLFATFRKLHISISFMEDGFDGNDRGGKDLKMSIDDIKALTPVFQEQLNKLETARHDLMIAQAIKKL